MRDVYVQRSIPHTKLENMGDEEAPVDVRLQPMVTTTIKKSRMSRTVGQKF